MDFKNNWPKTTTPHNASNSPPPSLNGVTSQQLEEALRILENF